MLLSCAAPAQEAGAQPEPQPAPQGGVVNRIAATVNGRPITASEVRMRLAPYFRELSLLYPQQGPRFNSELVKAKKEVLNELIERELVLSDFETKGYIMKDDNIEQEINRRILVGFNGDRRAAYALMDDEHACITLRRVAYNVEAAAPKIARTGLPASFAEALRRGASPTGD